MNDDVGLVEVDGRIAMGDADRAESGCLGGHQAPMGILNRNAVARGNRPERPDSAVPEIASVVGGFGQGQALSREHFAKSAEMQRLAVSEDAVEVEHDGANHCFIFSPARIGTLSRLSGGGYGHSYE